jgi:ABC-type lipoprotein export system ATPase subunit
MPLLSLRGVSKSYWRAGIPVAAICDASLDVEAGEFVAIYGASRSGKTTLLRLLAAIDRPDDGVIEFASQDLATLPRRELSLHRLRNTGCVWSAWRSVAGFDVLNHVALPLLADGYSRTSARPRAIDWLIRLGIEHLCDARPDELADGELVRVALAHAMVREPRMLLADEPVAGLGSADRDEILAILQRIARDEGAAVIITASHAQDVLRAKRIVALNCGELLEGPPPAQPELAQVVELSEVRQHRS